MKRVLVAITLIATMVVAGPPAGATPPADIAIEVETDLLGGPSPFRASGAGAAAGLLCEEGTVVDASANVTGMSPTGFNFHGVKHFTCEDGSGEFFVNLQARIDFRKGVTFQWNVVSGTGDYEDLHGAGRGVGLPFCGPDCVLDVYFGGVHID